MSASPRPWLAALAASAVVLAIAAADYASGYELRLAVLYLLPIGVVAWAAGRGWAAAVSLLAAAIWLLTFHSGHAYSSRFYYYWEAFMMIVSFLVVVDLVARLRAALARSDERFVTVLEELDAAVCVERGGDVLFANRSYRESFGAARPPGGSEGAAEVFVLETGRWYLRRERAIRWLDGAEARLRILADITELKAAEQSLRRHRDELERAARLAAVGEIGSSLAHELNQPLGAIATYLDTCAMVLRRAQAPEEALEAVERSRLQGARAAAIVQKLRDFLHRRTGAREATDVNTVAQRALELAEQRGTVAGATSALAAGLPPVAADPLLIEQVILNLLQNAAEAVQEAPQAGATIELRTARHGAGVQVSVIDGGGGVDPTAAERLFDPFFTTKPEGLGLGLGICRTIVEAHGGRLWHEPAAGRGTAFHFTLKAA